MMLSSARFIKVTNSMLTTWTIALRCLTVDQIDQAIDYCIQRRKIDNPGANFLPSTDEFIEIALRVDREKKKAQSLKLLIGIPEPEPNVVGQEDIKRNVELLTDSFIDASKQEKSIESDHIDTIQVYEFINPEIGEVTCYKAKGHHKIKDFEEAVKRFCGSIPVVVQHERYILKKTRLGTKDKPRIESEYFRTNRSESVIFTVGYTSYKYVVNPQF